MKHGYVKVAAARPEVFLGDTAANALEAVRLARLANDAGVRVLVYPELSLTGATVGDLFFSQALLKGACAALAAFCKETAELPLLSVVGLPIRVGGKLYDCAAVCQAGKVLGLVPKTHPTSMGGIDHARHFAPAPWETTAVTLDGTEVPFGNDLRFEAPMGLSIAIEIGEDIFAPTTPAAQLGATLICNPASLCEIVGMTLRRRSTLCNISARLDCAYIHAGAGRGESTTDATFGAHAFITECGKILAETLPFSMGELTVSEIDVETILSERMKDPLYEASSDGTSIPFSLPMEETVLTRYIDPHPFIPAFGPERAARCEEILRMQTEGLITRIKRAYAKKIVLGISGGLDSTLALLVMVRAIDALGRPRSDILAVTMPCFGTTVRTKSNATVLCEELGVDFRCVDIFDAVDQHFKDIGHDPALRDVTYENSQARERTQVLMDIANDCGGMVIGTGDLSELALGWATYNGDHMSMYGVNGDVPKTLIRHIVAYSADVYAKNRQKKIAEALYDILDTPVSPELLPAEEDGSIAQRTEDLVGPYELHDFYLYYMLRYGYSPEKLYRLAKYALGTEYDDETLKKWLKTFLRRFFSQQFKRSCLPDGPRVGSVAISPRGAWVMPSDASSKLWLEDPEQ